MLPGIKEFGDLIVSADSWWLRAVYVAISVLLSLTLILYGGASIWTAMSSAGKPLTKVTSATGETPAPLSLRQRLINDRFTPSKIENGLERLEKPIPHAQPYLREIDVRLLDGDTELAAARVIDIHAECAWKFRSAKAFVYFPRNACALETVLKDPIYRERLALARDVVFVGLNSFPKGDEGDEPKFPMSEKRALQLVRIIDRIYPELRKVDRHFWTLDLGRATETTTEGDLAEHNQRSAIIIGIDRRETRMPVKDILRHVTTTTTIGDVNLRAYERSQTATPSHVQGVWPGPNGTVFLDSTGKNYQ